MSSARENIMQRIRQANEFCAEANAQQMIEQRLHQHARGPRPQWPGNLITHFIKKAQQSAASISMVDGEADLVDAVRAYLVEQSVDNRLLCASTALIKGLNWPDDVFIEARAATTHDKVVLVEAFAGIAETGSVVMCSSQETPVSLNFLADYFICVVHQKNVVNTIDDLWKKIREEKSQMPRAVNIITGPSRTADVEQIIQMGAHGPRKVHVLLLD